MSPEPTLSFIIPVYKKDSDVFEKCLKSLHDITLKNVEIICVFDGPDEDLEKIAKTFHVEQFVIEHGGAPKARNFGLEKAKGKYIVFWDADCYAKPDGPKRWVEELELKPDIDFVYFGYEATKERMGHEGEPFHPYSLTCGNYISSMSPIRREKAGQWDETLEAAQDWDYWLTAVENGAKGFWIEGSGFVTDPKAGISSKHWTKETREGTIARVREKHGIIGRDIGVYSMNYRDRALKIAEILKADLIKPTGVDPATYRMIINLGYGYLSRFEGIDSSVIKVQYWIPGEIAGLAEARYPTVMETIRIAKNVVNLCNTPYEKNKLGELGISAEVVPLALMEDDIQKVESTLPKEFSVLLVNDEPYGKLLKEVQLDLPHIKFGYGSGKIKDYSCLMSFYQFSALDEAIITAHVNGRTVISNVQAPHCGFIDPTETWEIFKKNLYEAVREAKKKPFNKEAQAFYLDLASPAKFREKILGFMKPQLAVIS